MADKKRDPWLEHQIIVGRMAITCTAALSSLMASIADGRQMSKEEAIYFRDRCLGLLDQFDKVADRGDDNG